MGFFSNLKEHIPIVKNIGKPKSNKSSVELQYDKAMNLMENANGTEAVEILEKIADIGIMDQQYKTLGTDALISSAASMRPVPLRMQRLSVT